MSVLAIDIGQVTAILEPTRAFMARTVTNNENTPKIYTVRVEKISNPTSNGQSLDMPAGELLYTPKRFVLHGRQTQNVKIYYKGPEDDIERYYRITFIESPPAHLNDGQESRRSGALYLNIELQSILVVRPRLVRFSYELDEVEAALKNSGNTFFEFIVKSGCDEPDDKADTKYLLPGDAYINNKIAQPGNEKIIIYDAKFIRIGTRCSPSQM
ncbi:fimbria/pilus periplasmic chaperone [Aeromonas salmonicida]|uniref:fimbria/pilus periplasmic chaperone n=1 Tax=Aeromonas salmonicida TaxID=645 RepID=UPI001F357AF5|nr:fimbria/pilus periplasmic chaperone [Aeromonas salmonicida]MCE9933878.1 fimbria/pilus periplasmic chaperone [Aeromonas salmonicida]